MTSLITTTSRFLVRTRTLLLLIVTGVSCWTITVKSSPIIHLRGHALFWSRHSEIQGEDGGYKAEMLETGLRQLQNETYDLTSPRLWLEFCEQEQGHEGAYTVIRCDWSPFTKKWNLWGEDFHIKRLIHSYKFLREGLSGADVKDGDIAHTAMAATSHLRGLLLESAAESLTTKAKTEASLGQENDIIVVMLTLLWSPGVNSGIRIRGHAFSTGKAFTPELYDPDPLVVTVPSPAMKANELLPNRYEHLPTAKLSSWCRRRRPLESQFKTPEVGEVLLVRCSTQGVEILEGLTSNVFVVHRNGVLRTPPSDSALPGYARQEVLDHAKTLGIPIEIGQILFSDASEWMEVFLTSSIRLIAPVGEVAALGESGEESAIKQLVWSQGETRTSPIWKQIYASMLQ